MTTPDTPAPAMPNCDRCGTAMIPDAMQEIAMCPNPFCRDTPAPALALEAALGEWYDLIDRAVNALTDSVQASGNDARTNMHWVAKLHREAKALRAAPSAALARHDAEVREKALRWAYRSTGLDMRFSSRWQSEDDFVTGGCTAALAGGTP